MKLKELDDLCLSQNGMFMEQLLFLIAYVVDKFAPDKLSIKMQDFTLYPGFTQSNGSIDLKDIIDSNYCLNIIVLLVSNDNGEYTFSLAFTISRKVINLQYYIYSIV